MENPIDDFAKLRKLILLFPPLYFLHDLEEILTVESFILSHSNTIPFRVTAVEFAFAFTLLWIFALVGCFQTSRNRRFLGMKPVTFVSFLVPGILLANGIGHVFQFIFFRNYVPGIASSCLIIIPYSYFALKYLLKENLLTLKKFFLFFFLGFILQAPFAIIALLISKMILS